MRLPYRDVDMFEAIHARVREKLEGLPLNHKIDRLESLGHVITRLKNLTPEESVLIPLNDFADTPFEETFKIRFDLLGRMASMPDGPLEALMFLRDQDGEVRLLPSRDHMRVLDDQPIANPVTGERIENPAKRTHLGYTLRPLFMLDKIRNHHKAVLGEYTPGLLIIAPDANTCQRIGLLGVPAMTLPFDQLSHPDEARAAFWTLLEARGTLIATPDALPSGTVVPENTVITLFPGIPEGPVRESALAAQARLTRPVRTPSRELE